MFIDFLAGQPITEPNSELVSQWQIYGGNFKQIGHMRRLNDIMQGSYEIEKYIVFQKSICKVCCLDLLELSQMSAVQYSSAIQYT